MPSLLLNADGLLRGRLRADAPARSELLHLCTLVLSFGLLYGAVMGTFSGLGEGKLLQVVYSAVKVPLLLLATFALALPSFFVINTLMGLREDFLAATRALVATQAGLTVILASFSPFTATWYLSNDDYASAVLFNAVMFGLASLAAQVLLRRFYRPLIEKDARHRVLLRLWLVVYAFVGVQMGWLLRPFIGRPDIPTRFFREDAWGNAYIRVWEMVWRAVGG
jgi:hypothetical protein